MLEYEVGDDRTRHRTVEARPRTTEVNMAYWAEPVIFVLVILSFCSSAAFAQVQGDKRCEETPLSNAKATLYEAGATVAHRAPIKLAPGPHLFVDDYYIASSQNVKRVVDVPQRDPAVPNPIVTGKEDGCFQPYMTIIKDESRGRFRMWLGCRTEDMNASRSHIGYIESADGIHWERPVRILPDPAPIQFGVSVIDEGPNYPRPEARFKFGWYMDGGLKIATSPDGLAWTPLRPDPVLYHNHDITSIFYDNIRKRYMATVSVYREGGTWSGKRRITMQSYSPNLVDWCEPHYVLLPDASRDEGETQFYAMDGFLTRGELIVGMVKVLRDEVKVDNPPDPPDAYGMGYTELAWTRDGETWVRDPEPFFTPNPQKGTWDHAHAWVDDQVPVGEEVYLYYGGYARGHKVNRFEERQIGLLKMKRDRYVGRMASGGTGMIVTPLLLFGDGPARSKRAAPYLTVNANARGGVLRVQVSDGTGQPLPSFTFDDCIPVKEDALDAPVRWSQSLGAAQGKPVRLEFSLENACLYGFSIE